MIIKKIGLLLLLACLLTGCGESPQPTEAERAALNDILDRDYSVQDYEIITEDVMTEDREERFKAVKKVFITPEGDYAFISKPIAYNGPITLALVIDHQTQSTMGMRIVQHVETEHYVRDMYNGWFTDRFIGKSTDKYLELVHLEASKDNEIVIITGATVTTEGIANGVNACMGVFRETFLNRESLAVPYMVKFEKAAGEGPEENSSIAIRAYGTVIGKVTLEEIREMPRVKRTMSINSTAGTTRHQFTGTLLSNVITAVDPALLSKYDQVMPVGVDDYISNISMDEVKAENSVFIMYEDNGKALLNKKGQPGAMRVIVMDDVFGQRFTNYMIEIVLE